MEQAIEMCHGGTSWDWNTERGTESLKWDRSGTSCSTFSFHEMKSIYSSSLFFCILRANFRFFLSLLWFHFRHQRRSDLNLNEKTPWRSTREKEIFEMNKNNENAWVMASSSCNRKMKRELGPTAFWRNGLSKNKRIDAIPSSPFTL